MLVHQFSIDGFPHLVEVFEAQGANRVLLRKIVRSQSVELLRSELEPCATLAGNLLRELARLATQKAENLPDGSREFEHGGGLWRISFTDGGYPQLFKLNADGPVGVSWYESRAPHFQILAEQFAALGRAQGLREKVQILPTAAAIIRSIEKERDRARDDARDTFRDLNAARERIATLERDCDTWRDGCAVDQRDLAAARERIAELDQREEDSRSEVEDLLAQLEKQRARVVDLEATVADHGHQAERAGLAEKALAELEANFEARLVDRMEGFAQGCVAAVRVRTEGADLEMTAVYDGGNGGGHEPHVRLYVRRGDRIDVLAEDRGHYDPRTGAELSPPNREWVQLPPLPPVEPEQPIEAIRTEAPIACRHDSWGFDRGI